MGITKFENNKLIIDEINPDSPCPSLLNSTNICFTVIGIVEHRKHLPQELQHRITLKQELQLANYFTTGVTVP